MPTDDINLQVDHEIAFLTLGRAHCLDIAGKQTLMQRLTELRDSPSAARAVVICATHPAAWLVDVAELADIPGSEARVMRAARGMPEAALNALEEEAFPILFGPEQRTRMHGFLEQPKGH